jgi:23S rRNA pseudouridine1911/1915/1917 synthase
MMPPLDKENPALFPVTRERAGLRADDFLALALPRLSRTRIRQKIQTGESLLNGGRYATSARLREGDVITVYWRGADGAGNASKPARSDAPLAAGEPQSAPFIVLFEDEHIIAVDKPAGAAVHPVGPIQSGTLIQFVRHKLRSLTEEALCQGNRDIYPNLVHRLDMFTSGIVLIAKNREVLRAMHVLAASGGIAKRYTAVVEGLLDSGSGRIELPIGRDVKSAVKLKMAVVPDGLPCLTEYTVERRMEAHTMLRASPRTGRQHQIRVHLAAVGHPVWGDLLYKDEGLFLEYTRRAHGSDGASKEARAPALPPRHLLHADAVSFSHPVTGEKVEIHSPLPDDFMRIVSTLE